MKQSRVAYAIRSLINKKRFEVGERSGAYYRGGRLVERGRLIESLWYIKIASLRLTLVD